MTTVALRRPRQEDYGVAAKIRLNTRAFANYCRLARLQTTEDIARFLDMNASHIGRVLSGQRAVGADMIAAILDAFMRLDIEATDIFTDLFEIYRPDDVAEGVA